MATHAPITGAPAGAPVFRFTLDALEDVAGDFATLHAVIGIAANSEGIEATHLMEAALLVAKHVDDQLKALVAAGHADREGR